ncbi:MAG: radical SAM protein [Ignisphaera sp.]
MDISAPIFDSEKLKTCRLLRKRVRVKFYRIHDTYSHWNLVEKNINTRDIGIYIHIPFCRSICMFCPYFKDVLKNEQELEKYFSFLLKEIKMYGKQLKESDLNVTDIHVGGGTPSLVPPKLYRELIDTLAQFFNIKCSIGIEVNPEDFKNREYVENLYSANVDEVSIGVQSFDKRILMSIGRKHSPEDNIKAIENSLKAGFKWINIDLMILTPNIKDYIEIPLEEKLKIFREDMEKCYTLGVHQITFYPTIIPRSSPGYRLVGYNKLSQELDSIDLFIDEAIDFAESNNLYFIRVYSISRQRYEYATMNSLWIGPLLGFGPGSLSTVSLYQYINIHNLLKYINLVERDIPPAIYSRNINPSARIWRLFFDQLSSCEISDKAFRLIGLNKIPLRIKLLLKIMEINGLVKRNGDIYRLSRRGIKEVYKSVMNYVTKPVRLAEAITEISRYEDYPKIVEIV